MLFFHDLYHTQFTGKCYETERTIVYLYTFSTHFTLLPYLPIFFLVARGPVPVIVAAEPEAAPDLVNGPVPDPGGAAAAGPEAVPGVRLPLPGTTLATGPVPSLEARARKLTTRWISLATLQQGAPVGLGRPAATPPQTSRSRWSSSSGPAPPPRGLPLLRRKRRVDGLPRRRLGLAAPLLLLLPTDRRTDAFCSYIYGTIKVLCLLSIL